MPRYRIKSIKYPIDMKDQDKFCLVSLVGQALEIELEELEQEEGCCRCCGYLISDCTCEEDCPASECDGEECECVSKVKGNWEQAEKDKDTAIINACKEPNESLVKLSDVIRVLKKKYMCYECSNKAIDAIDELLNIGNN